MAIKNFIVILVGLISLMFFLSGCTIPFDDELDDLDVPLTPDDDDQDLADPVIEDPDTTSPVINEVTASSFEQTSSMNNSPDKTIDKDYSENSRWSAEGDQWLKFEFTNIATINEISIYFLNGDRKRSHSFDLEYSNNGADWIKINNYTSNKDAIWFETFFFEPITTKYFRYKGYGNSQNNWNSIIEITFDSPPEAPDTTEPTEPDNSEPTDPGNLEPVEPINNCTGDTTQSCTITNGVGEQTRTCNNGEWSTWSTCQVKNCNTGYKMQGNSCILIDTELEQALSYKIRNIQWSEIYTKEVHDYYSTQFNTEANYANVIYIDPTYTGGNNDGSITRPFTSLNNVSYNLKNTAFLIKRGTSHVIESISFTGSDMMIGAYGAGSVKPQISGGTLEFLGDNVLLRDVDLGNIRFGKHGGPWSDNGIIFNTKLQGTSGGVLFGINYRVIGVEIVGTSRNGIFFQQRDLTRDNNIEIGYSHIHKVNQIWFPEGKPQTTASGDGIMFNPFRGYYHYHNNIIDRSDTGNKFCIIGNAKREQYSVPYGPQDKYNVRGLIENNVCYAPNSYPSGGNGFYFGNVHDADANNHHSAIVRNNIMIGSKYPVGSDDYWTGSPLFSHTVGLTVYGNIFVDFSRSVSLSNGHSSPNDVYNNLFVNFKGTTGQMITGNNRNIFNNILHNNHYRSPTYRGNNIYLSRVDPTTIFVDYANEDFRLKANSPAINGGSWETWMDSDYNADFFGTPVPQNNNIAVGPIQYVATN